MALSFVVKAIIPIIGSLVVEETVLKPRFSNVYTFTSKDSMHIGIPKAFATVILFNIIISSATLIIIGFNVGGARKKMIEKATKDGDQDAEARFSYPKLYAEGFSSHAKQFNCIQRAHQQAFETYTQFVALSLVGGVYFPVTVSIGGIIWNYSRFKWAEGYSTGDPSNRYQHWASFGIWLSFLFTFFAAIGSAAKVSGLI
eukprot:gene4788-6715_t